MDVLKRSPESYGFGPICGTKNGPETLRQQRPALTKRKVIFAMAERALPTPAELRQLLRYEPETGKLFWRVTLSNRAPAGREAFTCISHGYRTGRIRGLMLRAHRVIWAMVHDRWPPEMIDHINCDRSDNRIENLREATAAENVLNRPVRHDSASGLKCVHFQKRENAWTSYLRINGRRKHLGYFATAEEAYAKYCDEARFHHGKFVRTE